jgi:hypothetical protein
MEVAKKPALPTSYFFVFQKKFVFNNVLLLVV